MYNLLSYFTVLIFCIFGINSKSQSLLDQLIDTKKNIFLQPTFFFTDSVSYKPIEYKVYTVDSVIIQNSDVNDIESYFQCDSINTKHGWYLAYKKGEFCIIGKFYLGQQHETWYYYEFKSKNVILKTSVTFEYGKKLSTGYKKKKVRRKKNKNKSFSLPSIVDMF